jgi:hypothetical protein
MLEAANLNVHLYIDEDDDGTTYVQAQMVRHDRQLLAQSNIVLPPQDQHAEPRDDWQIAADALSDWRRNLWISHFRPCPRSGQRTVDLWRFRADRPGLAG